MPSIRVQDTTTYGTRVVIEGLSFAANTYDYFEVEIWDYSNTVYSGSNVRWTESLTGNYAWTDIYGLTPNTGYTFKGFVRWQGGTRNHVGNVSFYTLSEGGGGDPDPPDEPTRPSDWNWSSLASSAYTNGLPTVVLLNASDWNNFCSKINEFRSYKGLSSYSFTTAISGSEITFNMYSEAVNAISSMVFVAQPSGHYSMMIALKDALNSIS
jgi:hypothetical protein